MHMNISSEYFLLNRLMTKTFSHKLDTSRGFFGAKLSLHLFEPISLPLVVVQYAICRYYSARLESQSISPFSNELIEH